jgi:NAD(P)-dependent dehydrogenase (short-subunit alcohol dehydrogenase family)
MRLAGKRILITGGGSGIGRACAKLFAAEGASVAIGGRRRAALESVAAEIQAGGGRCVASVCDVTDRRQVENAVREAVSAFGGLDVLVNNSGTTVVGTVEQTSDEDWERVLAVNLTGTFYVSRATLPELRRAGGGSIVNISSIYGLVGRTERAAYTASKGGVTLLTRAMALDHAAEKIRVNCICPAIVETDMVSAIIAQAPNPQEALRQRRAQIPLGRLGTPEDVAKLALFLASDESSWLTGAAIPLDGGFTAG